MVIEVPEELKDLGEAMAATLAAVKESLRRAAGGKALDYEAVECAISDAAAQVERAGHRAVLTALDVDRPVVSIGGARYDTAPLQVSLFTSGPSYVYESVSPIGPATEDSVPCVAW
jgi:hypothetical protein